jgi:hypothetical protein
MFRGDWQRQDKKKGTVEDWRRPGCASVTLKEYGIKAFRDFSTRDVSASGLPLDECNFPVLD